MTFAEQLRATRGTRDVREVARAISPLLSVKTYYGWERGRRTPALWEQEIILDRIQHPRKLSRAPRDWHGVDWSQRNAVIAQSLGVQKNYVSSMRSKLAPHTRQRQKEYDWGSVDWRLSNHEIAAKLGVRNIQFVSLKRGKLAGGVKGARKPYEPKAPRFTRWNSVDWSLPQAVIAKQMGVTPQAVSLHVVRRKTKVPPDAETGSREQSKSGQRIDFNGAAPGGKIKPSRPTE